MLCAHMNQQKSKQVLINLSVFHGLKSDFRELIVIENYDDLCF